MYIFVEPVTEEQITAIQTAKNAEIQQFEDEMYGNKKSGNEVEGEEQSWENLEADVQDAMDEDIRDPNHEDGRQDLDPKLVSAKQRVLEEGPSADEHNTTVESETEASPAIGMDEDADDEAEEEGEAEDEDAEETAIEAAEDDADDGGTEADEGKEDNEVHHGSSPQVHGEEFDTSGGEETSENRMDGSVTDSEAPIPNEATAANAVDWDSPGNATKNPDATSGDHTGADGSNDVDGREPLAGDASPISGDFASSQSISQDTHSARSGNEVLALTLTIRNMINGRPVLRPVDLKPNEQWAIEYSLDEVPSAERAWSLYQACQMRRRKKLDDDKELRENDDQVTGYIRKLREMSRKGAKWRKEQDEMDKELPVKILGSTVLSGEGDEA